MGLATPPKKKEGTAPFRLCVRGRVCVCDCLYLKKKNEAERHLGSGLDGKSPYQVSAQQLKMQLNSSLILLLLAVVVGFPPRAFFAFFYTPNPFVRSRHLPPDISTFWYFLACVISPLSTSLHPFCFFLKKKTTSFFRWITITKYSRYDIFSENLVLFLLFFFACAVYSKFPFLYRHFTQVIYDTGNRKKKDKKTGMSSGQSERSWWMTYSVW